MPTDQIQTTEDVDQATVNSTDQTDQTILNNEDQTDQTTLNGEEQTDQTILDTQDQTDQGTQVPLVTNAPVPAQGHNAGYLIGGIILAVCIITAAAYFFLKRKRPEEVVSKLSRNDAFSELKASASSFIGLYEPLWMIGEGQLKRYEDVFIDFDVRVSNLDNAPALIVLWSDTFSGFAGWNDRKAVKKAKELLDIIKQSGIYRSDEKEVIVERNVFKRYHPKDGVRMEPGTAAKVEVPCWYVDENVLEKGIISPSQNK